MSKLMVMVALIVACIALVPASGSASNLPQQDDQDAKPIHDLLSSPDCDRLFSGNLSRSCARTFVSAAANKTVPDEAALTICCRQLQKAGTSCLSGVSKEHAELKVALGTVCQQQLGRPNVTEKCDETEEAKKARKLTSGMYTKTYSRVPLVGLGLRVGLGVGLHV
ncbi:hypothetical protein ACP70R_008413 [Stipagrostis hirtigluma subsp. patula]